MDEDRILKGRDLIELYRKKRMKNPKNKDILNDLLKSLKDIGFDSVNDFFDKNTEFNISVFSTLYKVEGKCSHECHGMKRGCLESWYRRRMKETDNERNETLANIREAYFSWLSNKRGTPPACSYKLVKIGDTKIDILWR